METLYGEAFWGRFLKKCFSDAFLEKVFRRRLLEKLCGEGFEILLEKLYWAGLGKFSEFCLS